MSPIDVYGCMVDWRSTRELFVKDHWVPLRRGIQAPNITAPEFTKHLPGLFQEFDMLCLRIPFTEKDRDAVLTVPLFRAADLPEVKRLQPNSRYWRFGHRKVPGSFIAVFLTDEYSFLA